MVTKKYNPGFLTDDELVASFCVRTSEFESIIETLGENTGNSNQHLMVIGPRGSGKTNLMLRVAIESRRNPELSSRVFPVTFAEESYEVSTWGEFWLECLSRLADQAPQPDRASDLGRTARTCARCTTTGCWPSAAWAPCLLDCSDRAGKRLLIAVDKRVQHTTRLQQVRNLGDAPRIESQILHELRVATIARQAKHRIVSHLSRNRFEHPIDLQPPQRTPSPARGSPSSPQARDPWVSARSGSHAALEAIHSRLPHP